MRSILAAAAIVGLLLVNCGGNEVISTPNIESQQPFEKQIHNMQSVAYYLEPISESSELESIYDRIVVMDKQGNRLWSGFCLENGSLPRFECQYDEADNIAKLTSFDLNDSILDSLSYKYDENGNVIEESWITSTNTLFGGYLGTTFKYAYDQNGYQIKRDRYDPEGLLVGKQDYSYENGNQVENTYYNISGDMSHKMIFKYDDQGNQKESLVFDEDNSLEWRIVIAKHNDITESVTYDSNGAVVERFYSNCAERDERDNWTICVCKATIFSSSGELHSETEYTETRTITYWDDDRQKIE